MDDLSEARDRATEELLARIAGLERELERAKEDRNRAGVIERRKYLPQLAALGRKVTAADHMAKTLDSLAHQLGQARQSSPRDMLSTVCVALGAVNEARAAWQEASRG